MKSSSFKIPEIPTTEQTQIVEELLHIIQQQKDVIQKMEDEISRLKSLIKIRNIGPKYFDGIQLQTGNYKLLINKTGYCPQRFNIDIQNQDITKQVILKKKTRSGCTEKRTASCLNSEIKLTIRNNFGQSDKIICLKKGEYKISATYPDGKESEELILNN